MNKTGLIIHREYFSRVKKKSFIVMTILGPVLIAGLMGLGIYLGISDQSVYNVLVVDLTPALDDSGSGKGNPMFFNRLKNTDQVTFSYTDRGMSNAEFDSSAYSLMVVAREDILTVPEIEMVFRKLPSLKARSYIKSQIEKVIEREKLKLHNIEKGTYDSIRTDLDVISVDASDGTTSFKQEQAVVGFAFAVLIYFFIFLYGVQVMRGVMEEKSNRIVEVIISSVRPFQLMMGKIVGVALVGLTQFLVWVALTGILFSVVSQTFLPELSDPTTVQTTESVAKEINEDAMNEAVINEVAELILFRINWPVMISMFLFFFLGGYLLYASLFAAVGAAVDNETDTQQFMLPITIPLIFAFVVAEFALANPDGAAVFWFSVIPLTSPIVMMVRVAMGFDAGTIWQLFLSMGLLIAGFLGAVWLAAKIYRTGILMYGKKVTYKELYKWLRFKA